MECELPSIGVRVGPQDFFFRSFYRAKDYFAPNSMVVPLLTFFEGKALPFVSQWLSILVTGQAGVEMDSIYLSAQLVTKVVYF